MVTFQCTSTVSQKISQTSMQQFDIPQINPGPPGIRTKITGHRLPPLCCQVMRCLRSGRAAPSFWPCIRRKRRSPLRWRPMAATRLSGFGQAQVVMMVYMCLYVYMLYHWLVHGHIMMWILGIVGSS